jgi:hypothetical protein
VLPDTDFDNLLKSNRRSVWEIWSQNGYGPPAHLFGVVITLPNDRLALVPVSENGFEVEGSTYLRNDHSVFSSHKPELPILILYSAEDDTGTFIEPEFWKFLQDAIDKKKKASFSK